MMHWDTVNDQLKNVLLSLMREPIFNNFRLVGGTALSLQLGHRKSIDIDLIEQYMLDNFSYGSTSFGINPSQG